MEGFLDKTLPRNSADEIEISAPTEFLTDLFVGPVYGPDDKTEIAPPGSAAGPYFVKLIEFRGTMGTLGTPSLWYTLGPEAEAVSTIMTDSLQSHVARLFELRETMIDHLLKIWNDLSACVAQNFVRGANALPGERVLVDSCK